MKFNLKNRLTLVLTIGEYHIQINSTPSKRLWTTSSIPYLIQVYSTPLKRGIYNKPQSPVPCHISYYYYVFFLYDICSSRAWRVKMFWLGEWKCIFTFYLGQDHWRGYPFRPYPLQWLMTLLSPKSPASNLWLFASTYTFLTFLYPTSKMWVERLFEGDNFNNSRINFF